MTNRLLVDSENRRLIMDKTFARNAQIVGSVEYDMLQRARSDYATYSVVTRQIKRNPNKESYRGLTYQYIRKYLLEFGYVLTEGKEKNRHYTIITLPE